jgi:hypothetical protein
MIRTQTILKMCSRRLLIVITVAVGLFGVGPLSAQTQEEQSSTSSAPKPAGQSPLGIYYPDQDPSGDQTNQGLQPDTHPLTGVQNATLGSPDIRHSYWVPSFASSNLLRSAAFDQSTVTDWNSTTFLAGGVNLREAWANSDLTVNYLGGGYFSTDSLEGNGYFQQVGLAQEFRWPTWQVAFVDQFSDLPQAHFGFGAVTGITLKDVGGLQDIYQPDQTIFAGFGMRYTNAFTAQAVHEISSRASINIAGSFGILRFLEAGNIDSNDAIFNGGYNYALSKDDTIGVLYRYTAYRYNGTPQSLNGQIVQAAYGHKMTGRMALQLFFGPAFTTFAVPVRSISHQLGVSGGATFQYALGSNGLSLTYSHGLGNGSGILTGANVDQLQARLERRVSRRWSGDVSVGYGRNANLITSGGIGGSQAVNSYYVEAGLGRPLNRDASFSVAYTAQIQTSNQPLCSGGTGGACGTSFTVHGITVGFSWQAKPIVLR